MLIALCMVEYKCSNHARPLMVLTTLSTTALCAISFLFKKYLIIYLTQGRSYYI